MYPLILGQVNFFYGAPVCFIDRKLAFDVSSTLTGSEASAKEPISPLPAPGWTIEIGFVVRSL
jgi:hypothetical protein